MAAENPDKLIRPQAPATNQNVVPAATVKSNFRSKIKKLSLGIKFLMGGVILWIVVPAFFYLLSAIITGALGNIFISLAQFSTAIGALGILIGITLSFIRFIKHIVVSPETNTTLDSNNLLVSTTVSSTQSTPSLPVSPLRYPGKRLYLVLGILGLLAAPILFFGMQIMIWGAILGDNPSAADTQTAIPFQIFTWVIYIVFNVAGLVLLPLALIQYYRSHKQALDTAQASSNKAAIAQMALKLKDFFKSLAMFILFFPLVLAYLNMMQLAYVFYNNYLAAILIYLSFVLIAFYLLIRSSKYRNISQQNSI